MTADRRYKGRRAETGAPSPRDRFITVFGRMPVLEALQDPDLEVAKISIAENSNGRSLDDIVATAKRQAVEIEYTSAGRIKLLAGNGRQDQGVVADVVARRMATFNEFLVRQRGRETKAFLLDGVTNPGNVGMILRTATAAGLDGVILPRVGTPHVGPLVIKASAGVAFSAPIVNAYRAQEAADALRSEGYGLFGLAANAERSIFDINFDEKTVFVLGGETQGLSVETDVDVAIPMWAGVESLNVAAAAAIVSYEIARRRISGY